MTIEQVRKSLEEKGFHTADAEKVDNGILYKGFTIGEGTVKPFVYSVPESGDVEGFVQHLISNVIRNNKNDGEVSKMLEILNDKEALKDHLSFKPQRRAEIPFLKRECLDLDFVLIAKREGYDNTTQTVKLHKSHLERSGLDEQEAFEAASRNVRSDFSIMNMSDIIPDGLYPKESPDMFVISSRSRYGGASALLFPAIFGELCRKENLTQLVILPSSIHQVIALDANAFDVDSNDLINMITTVNKSEVQDNEVLSNHPYYYSLEDDKITY